MTGFARRPWNHTDLADLWEMLYASLHVPAASEPFPRSVLESPDIAHYLVDFGTRDGDDAQVATVVRTAWVRRRRERRQLDDDGPARSLSLRGAGAALR